MQYCVADVETSLYNQEEAPEGALHSELYSLEIEKSRDMASVWYHTKNRIIYHGELYSDQRCAYYRYDSVCIESVIANMVRWCIENDAELVGHNLTYDLLYWMKTSQYVRANVHKLRIFDTQVAEYMITGQLAQFASLDNITKKYGGEVKDARVKDYWNRGISTEDVPKYLIEPYLTGDLTNTETCYLQQRERLHVLGMWPLFDVRRRAQVANTEATYNGIRHDVQANFSYREPLEALAAERRAQIVNIMSPYFPDEVEVNPASSSQLCALIYGGTVRYKERKLKWLEDGKPDVFKGGKTPGQQKSKLYEVERRITGQIPNTFEVPKSWLSEKTGKPSLAEFQQSQIPHIPGLSKEMVELLVLLKDYKKVTKDVSTYFTSYVKYTSKGGYVHPQFNETATITGRYSSSKPNGQNISKSDIKKCLVSRFGANGKIVQIDFTQIEVVGEAVITRDANLISDVLAGTDMHCVTVTYIRPEWAYEDIIRRKKANDAEVLQLRNDGKPARFLMTYGGGAAAMAEQSGLSEKLCKDIIKKEAERYPEAEKYKQGILKAVTANLRTVPGRVIVTKQGPVFPVEVGKWQGPTGRIFSFLTAESPQFLKDKGQWTGISPTKTKNYPIQGTCGGDVVPIALMDAYEAIKRNKNFMKPVDGFDASVYYISTVHDAGYYDVHNDQIEEFEPFIKNIYTSVDKRIKELYNFDWFLPLPAEISTNPTMKEETPDA